MTVNGLRSFILVLASEEMVSGTHEPSLIMFTCFPLTDRTVIESQPCWESLKSHNSKVSPILKLFQGWGRRIELFFFNSCLGFIPVWNDWSASFSLLVAEGKGPEEEGS